VRSSQPQSRKSKPAPSLRARRLPSSRGVNTRGRNSSASSSLTRKIQRKFLRCSGVEQRGWLSERRVAEEFDRSTRGVTAHSALATSCAKRRLRETISGGWRPQGNRTGAARAVWQKKFGSCRANANEKARQIRFLQSRGSASTDSSSSEHRRLAFPEESGLRGRREERNESFMFHLHRSTLASSSILTFSLSALHSFSLKSTLF